MSAYYNENDPKAAGWLRNLIAAGHIAPGDVDERSIADVRSGELEGYAQCHFFAGIGGWSHALRLAGWDDARSVWTGSCPCQPFSAAGKREGFNDARHLWPVFRDLIAKRRPATVFGEQVAAASDWLRLVRSDLEALDYAVGCMPIEAASAGADHLRDRFWFVADADREAWRPEARAAVAAASCATLGLRTVQSGRRGSDFVADPERDRWQQGTEVFRERKHLLASCRQDGGDVAVTDSEGQQRQPEHGEVAGQRGGLGVGNGGGARRGRDAGAVPGAQAESGGERIENGDRAVEPGLASSYEWVIGADGKARRVKPGIRLLAHGFPGRVGLLRGFGNAIDPRPAAAFIGAYLDV